MRTRWWLVLAIASLMVLAACGDDSGSDAPTATLRIHAGAVEVDSGSGFAAASDGLTLTEGSTVRTGADGRASIEWFDGSETRLDFGTTFTIVTMQVLDGDGKIIEGEQSTGNTYNRVTALTDSASRFDIETPTATASVQGTVYAVLLNADGSTTIAVVEGGVTSNGVTIPAGYYATVDAEGNVSEPQPIPDDLIDDDWIVYNCELDEGPDCPDETTTTTVAGPEEPPTTTTTSTTSTTTTVPPTTTTTTRPRPPATTTTSTTSTTSTTTTSTTVPPTTTTTTVGDGPEEPPAFDHVEIAPSSATVDLGEAQAFSATAIDTEGGVLGDVTGDAVFTIDGDGVCEGNECSSDTPGEYTVTVLYMDTQDQATLNVVAFGSGDVEVFLSWTGPADMDLWVTDPDGCTVKWSNTSCESGGTLQVDMIPGCGSSPEAVHVEQIYWPEGGAPQGSYMATADVFSLCDVTTNWTMSIWVNGAKVHEIEGTHTSSSDAENISQAFSVPTPA